MRLLHIFIFSVFFYSTLWTQTGPGGVGQTNGASNLVLWLDASKGTTVAGSAVTQWSDQSGYNNHAIPPSVAARPQLVANNVNGIYSSINFDGLNDELWITDAASIDLTQWHFFIVTKTDINKDFNALITKGVDATENYEFLGFADGSWHLPIYYTDGTRTLPNTSVGQISTVNFDIFEYSYSSGVGRDVYKNNTSIQTDNDAKTPQVNNNPIYIGNELGTAGRYLDGDIAEIIIFNAPLNAAQRVIVYNYLAAKYNRLLGASDNYTQDNAGNGNFDHEVAGIGRTAAASEQVDSKGTGIVRISGATALSNGDYLIWGHNNLLQQANNLVDVPAGVQARFSRVWRVSEVGTVGNVDMRWDLTGLGAVTASDLRLLIDLNNNGNFNDDVPIAGATNPIGNIFQFSAVPDASLSDGRRFTLATINKLQTPLPIELTFFDAIPDDISTKVNIEWQTASERNNDFFTIERSIDGDQWNDIQQIKGSGNSNYLINYNTEDADPILGVSYYRLRQTDFDGKSTLSEVKTVNFVTNNDLIYAYPNPGKDQITLSVESSKVDNINIYTTFGQEVTKRVLLEKNNQNSLSLNVSELTAGIYTILINVNGEKQSIRFVKL